MSLETILTSLDGVHQKITATSAKTAAELSRLSAEQREQAERIVSLEQRGSVGHDASAGHPGASLGARVAAELIAQGDLLQKTGRLRLQIETKAATDPVGTSSGRMVAVGGAGAPMARALGIQYGLPRRQQGGLSAMEYSRYTGVQGAAAQQAAEGDAKAAVRPDHSIIAQQALTIAGYAKLSRQALTDAAQLRQAVEVTLQRSIDTALDVALSTGATNFAGGFVGLATAATSAVYTALPDAVSEGVATMQSAGFEPDVVFLNPQTWLSVCVARGTSNDHYLSGSYLGTLPPQLRGLRVLLSPTVAATKALVIDSRHVELLDVWPYSFEAAYSGDDFTSNLSTLRAEVRVLPVFLTVGAARFITPKA